VVQYLSICVENLPALSVLDMKVNDPEFIKIVEIN
jgi:hypothetical protein